MLRKINKNISKKVIDDNERGARRQILEELFYDFNRSRVSVYWTNFVRGICLGFGTVLGGTVVVALVIWLLSLFVSAPFIGDYIHQIIEAIQSAK